MKEGMTEWSSPFMMLLFKLSLERSDERIHLLIGENQRRRKAQHIAGGRAGDKAALEQPAHERACREILRQLDADEHAHAADLEDLVALDGLERVHQIRALFLGDGAVVVLDHEAHRAQRYGAGERVAAEGGAVVALGNLAGDLLAGQNRADREAAAEALGAGHDVGNHVVELIAVQRARAADAGLHLVEDQQNAVFVAQRAHGPFPGS